MLRGRGVLGFLVSCCFWFLGFLFFGFLVSKFLGFLVFGLFGFKDSWFLGVRDSCFLGFKVSKIYHMFVSCFQEDLDPISKIFKILY